MVVGWSPLGERPAADDDVFEPLTTAVFQVRFLPAAVRTHAPAGYPPRLGGFHPATVASWPDERRAVPMDAEGMNPNGKKIRATLRYARPAARSRQCSSAQYVRAFGSRENALVRGVDTWRHFGTPSIRWFVRGLGGAHRR